MPPPTLRQVPLPLPWLKHFPIPWPTAAHVQRKWDRRNLQGLLRIHQRKMCFSWTEEARAKPWNTKVEARRVRRFKVSVQLGVTWGQSNEIHSLFRGKEERGESRRVHSVTHLAGGSCNRQGDNFEFLEASSLELKISGVLSKCAFDPGQIP